MDTEQQQLEVAEELALCQVELAQTHARLEQMAEEMALLQGRVRMLRKQSRRLATAVVDHLSEAHTYRSVRGPLGRLRRRRRPDIDRTSVDLVRASPLFDEIWYVRQHTDSVLRAGMDPARHYLKIGAVRGWDPSPQFDAADYLRQNPEVESSGENPLVSFLRLQTHNARSGA